MTEPYVYRHGPPYLGLEVWIRDSHQIAISPLEYNQTGDGVVPFRRSIVKELDEDKGIDRTAPRLATIHSCSNPSAPSACSATAILRYGDIPVQYWREPSFSFWREETPLANAVPKAWRAFVHYHWNLQRLGGPEGHAQGEKPEKRPHGGGSAGDAAIERWQRLGAAVEEAKRLVGA